jgi:hypothetical protein
LANSTIVSDLKKAVIKEIVNDDMFFHAINSPDISDVEFADELIGKNIFTYHQNPETITKVGTFMTLQVHIPKTFGRSKVLIAPTLEIWIISHQDHMKVKNVPKVTDNRNDYISMLLDKKFNGSSVLGGSSNSKNNLHLCGRLKLISNTEGAFSPEYLFRRRVFETVDINDSVCG